MVRDGRLRSLVADHYTAITTSLALSMASAALVVGEPLLAVPSAVGLALAVVFAGPIRRSFDPRAGSVDPETVRALDELRRGYAAGDVDDEEYERRYDAIVERSRGTGRRDSPVEGIPESERRYDAPIERDPETERRYEDPADRNPESERLRREKDR